MSLRRRMKMGSPTTIIAKGSERLSHQILAPETYLVAMWLLSPSSSLHILVFCSECLGDFGNQWASALICLVSYRTQSNLCNMPMSGVPRRCMA